MSRKKLFLFSSITTLLVLSCLELSARVVLSLKKHSWDFIFYGVKGSAPEKNPGLADRKFAWVTGDTGERLYYKAPPSRDTVNPVNSLGFRGRELQKKTGGMIRIVCLGGSTTYGTGLNHGDTYPTLLQGKLDQQCGTGRYEVVNAGQPAFTLPHMIRLTEREIVHLEPDMLIVMSINNNLKAPGFWFLERAGSEKDLPSYLRSAKRWMVRHSVLGVLVNGILGETGGTGAGHYLRTFDWESFSRALMSDDNIWQEEYRSNLQRLVEVFLGSNPAGKVLFLEEAVNTLRYPSLGEPFNRAQEIARTIALACPNVCTLDVRSALIASAQEGEPVWQSEETDPLHLSGRGNELLADFVTKATLFKKCAR